MDKSVGKEIKLDYQDNSYKGANQPQGWGGLDNMINEIDQELNKKAGMKKKTK